MSFVGASRSFALSGLEKERLLPPLYLAQEGTAAGLQGSVKGDRYDCFGPSGFKPRRMTAFPISLSLLGWVWALEGTTRNEPQSSRTGYSRLDPLFQIQSAFLHGRGSDLPAMEPSSIPFTHKGPTEHAKSRRRIYVNTAASASGHFVIHSFQLIENQKHLLSCGRPQAIDRGLCHHAKRNLLASAFW
jgi:hypothetical protein